MDVLSFFCQYFSNIEEKKKKNEEKYEKNNVFIDWIKKYHSYFKKGAIISDVTGVKGKIVYQIQELLKDEEVEFIGAHPMAGKEVYGVQNSDCNIFKNANYFFIIIISMHLLLIFQRF